MMHESTRLRIQPVPERLGTCFICRRKMLCRHTDHDFRGAGVCDDCAPAVITAEINLRNAHLCVPTDSIMEGHL